MRILIPLLITALLALPATAEPQVELDSEDDKIIYSIGVSMGRSLMALDLSETEVEILTRGMQDQVYDRQLTVEFVEYEPKMNDLAARRKARVAKAES